jgi:hypothetical protein
MADLNAELAEQVEHATHCHTNLASCSAQPLPAGIGLLRTQEALFLPPSLQAAVRIVHNSVFRSGPRRPPLPPPPRFDS